MNKMPHPVNFAESLYSAYRKRYLDSHDNNEQEWNRLLTLNIDQLADEGHSLEEMLAILTAQDAKKMMEDA